MTGPTELMWTVFLAKVALLLAAFPFRRRLAAWRDRRLFERAQRRAREAPDAA